jgi:hypothetical protein
MNLLLFCALWHCLVCLCELSCVSFLQVNVHLLNPAQKQNLAFSVSHSLDFVLVLSRHVCLGSSFFEYFAD